MELKITQVSELKEDFNANHRKEKNFVKEYAVMVIDGGCIDFKIKFRLYKTKNTTYGVLWFYDQYGTDFVTSSKATGGGYSKEDYILNDCLVKMGFESNQPCLWNVEKVLIAILDCVYGENYFEDVLINIAQG